MEENFISQSNILVLNDLRAALYFSTPTPQYYCSPVLSNFNPSPTEEIFPIDINRSYFPSPVMSQYSDPNPCPSPEPNFTNSPHLSPYFQTHLSHNSPYPQSIDDDFCSPPSPIQTPPLTTLQLKIPMAPMTPTIPSMEIGLYEVPTTNTGFIFDQPYTLSSPPPNARSKIRKMVACDYCHEKKRRCNFGDPCKRCLDRGIECTKMRKTKKKTVIDFA